MFSSIIYYIVHVRHLRHTVEQMHFEHSPQSTHFILRYSGRLKLHVLACACLKTLKERKCDTQPA